jgi:hypothetical protein
MSKTIRRVHFELQRGAVISVFITVLLKEMCWSVMPVIWILLFALMTYIAVFEIKKTKRGYRYNTFLVLGSNLFCTVLGAIILHCFGMGYALDHRLGMEIGMYKSMDKMELRMWQSPDQGRLLGELAPVRVFDDDSAPAVLNFKDSLGVVWRLSVDELQERELRLLVDQKSVKLIGTTTSDFSFHVCGVFPWQQGRALGLREMLEGRNQFDTVMHEKMERIEEWTETITGTQENQNSTNESLCSHLPVMKRMR